jgi:anti-anti-sigma factor
MVEITQEGGWIVVRVAGDIDMATAPVIGDRLSELRRLGYRNIRIDVALAGFMDLGGLNMLAGAYKSAADLGGTLMVVNATLQVRKVFELAGLERLVSVNHEAAADDSHPAA